jgi:phage protein D
VSQDAALSRQLYVKINAMPLQTTVMDELYRVEVESSLSLPAMCVLFVHDSDAGLTNQGPFDLGAAIEVGVADDQGRGETLLFDGEITGIEPDFREGTVADLVIRAYDRSHRLHRGATIKTYANMTDSAIASDVASQAGLQADVEATSTEHKHVFQHGQTHMEFLRERARRIGYDVYVDGRTLCFKSGSAQGATVNLEWGDKLRSFRPVLTLGEQVSEVEVHGWDPATKSEIVGRASSGEAAPQIGEQGTGGSLAESAFGNAKELAVSAGVVDRAEADDMAQAILNDYDGAFVEAEGECFGQPDLMARKMVNITALGNRFNGSYRVTSARHIWSTARDYMTHFTVRGRRDETLSHLIAGPAEPRTTWPVMTGVVTSLDDPDEMGRVTVKFPWLDPALSSQWARVVGIGAGADRGMYWLPEVNDEVLVAFEQGDISRPIVLGGLWNGEDAPPIDKSTAVSNGTVVQRVLVTRTGHKITLSDENPAFVRIETAGGHILVLHDDDGKIEITTSGNSILSLDDNGNKITLKGGGDLEIEAGLNASIKAGGNLEIEASGNLTIKGAVIQLNP